MMKFMKGKRFCKLRENKRELMEHKLIVVGRNLEHCITWYIAR